jgi:hypothetical protein
MGAQRSAPLCWGQRYIWLDHHQLPADARDELNFAIRYDPPPGSTVDNLRLALNGLARRYESLRTRFLPDGPVQVVDPLRPVPVRCHETSDAGEAATDVVNAVSTAPFRLDSEWPIRAVVVTTDSVPKLMVVVGHHIAVDDWSLELLKKEFASMHGAIVARQPLRLPPVRHHPVELARFEASPAGQEINARALSYWDSTLALVPADMFAARRSLGDAPPHSATLSSPAALAAAHTLAQRHGVWPSMIHTAAFAAQLAEFSGSPNVAYRTFASNRDLPQYGDIMSCLFQPTLVHTMVPPDFDELIRLTVKDCGVAMENSYFAHDEALEVVAKRGARLGTAINFLRYDYMSRGGTRTVFTSNAVPKKWALLGDDCYLRVSEWQDCVVTTLYAAGSIMSADDVETFLRGMEALMVTSASA